MRAQTGPGSRSRRPEEVRDETKKTGRSAPAVKKTVKNVGSSRNRAEKRFAR